MDAKTITSKFNGMLADYGDILAAVGTKDSLDLYTKKK